MAVQKHVLSFFIIISFVGRYSTLQEDPHNAYFDDSPNTINGGGGTFENLLRQSPDVLRLNRFDQLVGPSLSPNKVNVNDYGAIGDGTTDDTQAFKKAWKVACSSGEAVSLVVPRQNYLLKPIGFSGPCKSAITVKISGVLEASDNPSDYSHDPTHWLEFKFVQSLSVEGDGTINGKGNIWWQNSCKRNKKLPCKNAPTALTFYMCKNLVVKNLTIKNAQKMHVSFQDSSYVRASGLTVTAPEGSPNTDGIHITNTQNIQISSSVIRTGDDCISIVSGSQDVQATDITCGPGHGISIGSLGAKQTEAFVSGITVNGAKLSGTTNGVRIKTWQGGSGSASNIKFQNIEMNNVTNPIIINQNYCDQKVPCKQQYSAVQIKDVLYRNIKGTSASEVGVTFDCSEIFPCEGIVMQNVDLKLESGEASKASCDNVQVSHIGHVSPLCPQA
ncbi:polygalacturonase [Prosopis cineraria]|uniref:polygalacturonase n=1 Tax=Prosopis cineraria TaxID=364024 RepID=UPI00240EE2B6|nr:polygalacturonase [Prosopis cineraria]